MLAARPPEDAQPGAATAAPRGRKAQFTDHELAISVPRLLWAKRKRGLTILAALVVVAGALTYVLTRPSSTDWVEQQNPAPQIGALTSITCSLQDRCMIANVQGQAIVTPNRGASWEVGGNSIPGLQQLAGTSCSSYECVVLARDGGLWFSGDGGEQFDGGYVDGGGIYWTAPVGVGQYWSSQNLSCTPSGNQCIALIANSPSGISQVAYVHTFSSSGRYFHLLSVGTQGFRDTGGEPDQPFCISLDVCEAIGLSGSPDSVWRTTNGGRTWFGQGLSGVGVDSIYCTSVLVCAAGATDGSVYFTADGGKSWQQRGVAQWQLGGGLNQDPATAVYCWTALHCVVGSQSSAMVETYNGGKSWSNQSIPHGAEISAIACGSGYNCWAVGSQGTIYGPGVILKLVSH